MHILDYKSTLQNAINDFNNNRLELRTEGRSRDPFWVFKIEINMREFFIFYRLIKCHFLKKVLSGGIYAIGQILYFKTLSEIYRY